MQTISSWTTQFTMRLENTDKQTKKKYFDKLLSLSQVGLVANPAQTETAEFALMKLKDEIVLVEGKRIKNHYMKYLGMQTLHGIALLSHQITA